MRAAGPFVPPVPCSGCGKLIDPLRAGHMAIFDQRFHYFCNRTTCRAAFLGEPPELTPETRRAAEAAIREENALRRATLDAPIIDAFPPVTALDDLPEVPATDDDRSLVEPFSQTILSEGPSRFDA
ncbi:MAG TPA: hypothetical protein VK459_25825, partial [Polyangiaceae bacterium]|nr:hypothetical protein [Polyangiaceae bacterium]